MGAMLTTYENAVPNERPNKCLLRDYDRALSIKNWKRPKTEISFLFKLIKSYFTKEIQSVISQGIKINILGDLNKLSKELRSVLKRTEKLTEDVEKIIRNGSGKHQ